MYTLYLARIEAIESFEVISEIGDKLITNKLTSGRGALVIDRSEVGLKYYETVEKAIDHLVYDLQQQVNSLNSIISSIRSGDLSI